MLSFDNNDEKRKIHIGKTYFTDLLRTVKSSKLLFVSISVICMLSICSFCGIYFTNIATKNLADEFYTDSNFYDLMVQCPIGFVSSDVDDIKDNSYVKNAELNYSTQKFINGGDKKIVAEFHSSSDIINIPTVVDGKMPKGENECAIEVELSNQLGLNIGDTIKVLSDKSPLLFDEFEITAVVILPQVFMKDVEYSRGVASIGNGEISTYIIVDETAFEESTLPNIMYITLKKDFSFFSNEYFSLLSEASKSIATYGSKLAAERFENNIDEYRSDLESTKKQYSDGEETYLKYLSEFEEAESRLNKYGAGSVSDSVEEELTSNREQLNDAEYQLKIASNYIKLKEKTLNLIENKEGWVVLDSSSNFSFYNFLKSCECMNDIMLTICCMFVLVSVIISFATVSRLVNEQRVIIGTQKALGLSHLEISMKYVLYVMASEIIGMIFGAFISYYVFEPLIYKISFVDYYYYDSFKQYFSVPPFLAVGFLLVASGALSAFMAAYKILRMEASLLMSGSLGERNEKYKGKSVDSKYIRTAVVGSFRNLTKDRASFLALFSGVCGIVLLMVTVFTVYYSVANVTKVQYREVQSFDYTIYSDKDATYTERAALDSYIYNYKVTSSVCLNEKRTAVLKDGRFIFSTVLITDSQNLLPFIETTDVETGQNLDVPENGVLISESLAYYYGYRVGDKISIADSLGCECETFVSGIFDYYIGYTLVMSPETYIDITDELPDMSQYYVKIYKVNLEDFISGLYEYPAFVGIKKMSNSELSVEKITFSIRKIVLIFLVFSIMLTFFVVFNFAVMNISKKHGQLSVMYSLGTTVKGIFMYAIADNILVSISAIFVGIIIGVLCGRFITASLRYEYYLLINEISIPAILISVAISVFFIFIATLLSLRPMRKISMTKMTRGEF